MRRTTLTALLATAVVATGPAPALAASGDVIRDCQDGSISGKYSQKDYADALRNIPTDVDEYTDCRDVIQRARLGAAGGGSGGGAGGGTDGAGGVLPGGGGAGGQSAQQLLEGASETERAAVADAVGSGGTAPVTIGGRAVSPATAGLSPAGAANVVPTPLIVALVLVGVALALGATQTIRSRVLARRTPAA